jgi:ABC-type antimicrobial peptide transport system, permease component
MNPLVAFRVSYRALKKNKVRSILTTLGIIIGVAAVITMVTLTQGAKRLIEEQLVSLGGNSLIINSGMRAGSGVTAESSGVKPLTAEDAEAIRELGLVTYVSAIGYDGDGYLRQSELVYDYSWGFTRFYVYKRLVPPKWEFLYPGRR